MHRKMDSVSDLAISSFDVDWKTLAPEEAQDRLQDFFDKMFRLHYRVPKSQRAIPWIRNELDSALHPRLESLFDRSFLDVSEALGWLIGELFKENRITDAQSFFSSFAKSPEAFSLAQLYA